MSSDLSLQPGPAVSETDLAGPAGRFTSLPTGPFFDVDQNGVLFVIDHEFSPDLALQWFQAIAVQRTAFAQFDRLVAELGAGSGRGHLGGITLVITGSEWHEAVHLPVFGLDSTHLECHGALRRMNFLCMRRYNFGLCARTWTDMSRKGSWIGIYWQITHVRMTKELRLCLSMTLRSQKRINWPYSDHR